MGISVSLADISEYLNQLNDRYGTFAEKLLHLAREMDEEAILVLVKQSIAESQH